MTSLLWFLLQVGHQAAPPITPLAPGGATFEGLGDLPGGEFASQLLALSADGRVAVGCSAAEGSPREAFLWRAEQGLTPLGPAEPHALTPGAEILVGDRITGADARQAVWWSLEQGWSGLQDPEVGARASSALGIARDGRAIVGWVRAGAQRRAVLWEDGEPRRLPDPEGGTKDSYALRVSLDGKTAVGAGTSERGPELLRWTAAGCVALGDLPGGAHACTPFGMSGDGDVIVGESSSGSGMEACLWTEGEGLRGLGDLPGGAFESRALAVSDDGRRIVGRGTSATGPEAFVWERVRGLRPLSAALREAGASGLEGWTLTEALALSADGRFLAGNGNDPAGRPQAWIARLP